MKPFISIVMAYFNRKPQLAFTLATIGKSALKDRIEVIIVDDGSDNEHVLGCEDLAYPFAIQVHRIAPEHKTWINPVIPYNLGISKAKGEWIILQNPEVCHVGDVCAYVASADPDLYHVLRVWALDEKVPVEAYRPIIMEENPYPKVNRLTRRSWNGGWGGQWYSTPRKPYRAYHFCSALHSSVMAKIGGFNPVMASGVWYDDDELLARIRKVVTRVHFVDGPIMAIHQWHPLFENTLAKKIPTRVQRFLKGKNHAILQQALTDPSLVHVSIESGLPPCYSTLTNV